MDIKLKNMTKTQEELILYGGWLLLGIVVTMGSIFYYYGGAWRVISAILIIGALVLGGVLLWQTVKYVKKYPLKEEIKEHKIDRINSELLVVIFLFTLYRWIEALTPSGRYVWGRFALTDIFMIIVFILLLICLLICMSGSLLILVRQYVFESFPKTSLICKVVLRRKNRMNLEEKIYKPKRVGFYLGVVCSVCIFICALELSYYGNEFLSVLIVICMSVMLLIVFCCSFSNKMLHEIACLAGQIEKMSKGEDIPEEMIIPEDSLFYEASHQLRDVNTAMQNSIKKQVQAEKMKVDLITNVSHDLKTPLTSMIGYTDLLKKEDLSPEARDYVDVISVKQEKLKDMIQDLFELSKATSGVEQMVMENLDMRKLLEQTLGDMEDAIKESGKEIRTRFAEEPLLFRGDNEKMYRVVQNLLENAIKYSLDGTRIYLDARREGNRIYAEIKNIASYEMDFAPEEIMERFVRGDESRSTEGHGLGLAISSSFVRNMDGIMDIEIDGDLFKVILNFPAMQGE